jgi:glyoxylase I family protein
MDMRFFHTALSVQNMERSRAFYENVFKLRFRTGAERKELGIKFINLQDDLENVVELFEHIDPQPLDTDLMDFQKIGLKHIAFIVESLEKTIAEAITNGGSLIRRPREGKTVKRNAFIGDPDGIPIELVEL